MSQQKQLRQPSLEEIQDPASRRSLQWFKDFIGQLDLLRGNFQFFELTFSADKTNLKVNHTLGFQPKDFIQTSLTGTGSITYNYSLMSSTQFDLTLASTDPDDPLVVRFFAGSYQ